MSWGLRHVQQQLKLLRSQVDLVLSHGHAVLGHVDHKVANANGLTLRRIGRLAAQMRANSWL